jgi:hypothetical protein
MSWDVALFEPLDALANADPRALELGGWGHSAEITPGAFAGSLRTLILRRAGYDFQQQKAASQATGPLRAARAVGVPGAEGAMSFRFAGPLLARADGVLLFPHPAIFHWREGDPTSLGALRPAPAARLAHDADPEIVLLAPPERALRPDPRLVTLPHLCWLLSRAAAAATPRSAALEAGGFAREDAIERDMIVRSERRTGHTRAPSGVAEAGKLFSRSLERPCWSAAQRRPHGRAGLLRGVEEWLPPGTSALARLGGDAHLVRLRVEAAGARLDPARRLLALVQESLDPLGGLALYLATPAIFREGWRPPPLAGLSLVAAAVGRPQIVAGWDLKRRRPKPIHRAVPAGSTYLFRVEEAAAASATAERFHLDQPLSDVDGELGFGLALAGTFDARDFPRRS